jgi:hypothetical protein
LCWWSDRKDPVLSQKDAVRATATGLAMALPSSMRPSRAALLCQTLCAPPRPVPSGGRFCAPILCGGHRDVYEAALDSGEQARPAPAEDGEP